MGKIALFGKALVVELACGALPMCAMWVGFLSSFFAGGRKKQNKFPSNLHCPVKKLNPFLFSIYHYRICLVVCRSYTCCQRFAALRSGGLKIASLSSKYKCFLESLPFNLPLNPPLRQAAVIGRRFCLIKNITD
ncbi:hypothetical protein SDC9_44149 [bioreactor metagenome]|uniref:Uncharacterized protein n=1 Tax=bioreactor metagenome TaxID=1076179 RepID=A0A644W5R2_9ZZZZ